MYIIVHRAIGEKSNMLPDFPKIKAKVGEALNRFVRNLIRQEPLLSRITNVRVFEGNRLATKGVTDEIDQSPFKEMRSDLVIDRKELIDKGIMAYIENIQGTVEDIQRQQTKMVFEGVQKATERIGNIVDGKGRPFDFELFYGVVEKVQIEFDEAGNPFLPQLFVSPELGLKLKELMPQWNANPDYKQRMEALMAKKRKEWNDRESNRKLVD